MGFFLLVKHVILGLSLGIQIVTISNPLLFSTVRHLVLLDGIILTKSSVASSGVQDNADGEDQREVHRQDQERQRQATHQR